MHFSTMNPRESSLIAINMSQQIFPNVQSFLNPCHLSHLFNL